MDENYYREWVAKAKAERERCLRIETTATILSGMLANKWGDPLDISRQYTLLEHAQSLTEAIFDGPKVK